MPTVNEKYVLALDLGGTALRGGIVSADGTLSMFQTVDTAADRSITTVIQQVVDTVEELATKAKQQEIELSAVGLALPGFLALKEQGIHFSPNFPDWNGVSIGALLRKKISLPLALLNDGNAHALGEWWRGGARGYRHIVVLTLGTGVGGGIIVDNRLVEGSNGAGGELGHMVVLPEGTLCACGNYGCLEIVASGTALQRASGKSAAALEDDAKAGDMAAQKHFGEMGYYLGIALSSLVFMLQPEIIILGGKLSRAFDLFAPSMRKEMSRRLVHHPTIGLPVIQSRFIDQAGLLGAACRAFE